uniref:Uncharacterized protein n=1 Tax=Phaeomonas parva TaxID=124430 RepID=A0A7S1UHU7_9STRA
MARELRHAPRLQRLDLRANAIGAAGAEAVALLFVEAPPWALRDVDGIDLAAALERRKLLWPLARGRSDGAILGEMRRPAQEVYALLLALHRRNFFLDSEGHIMRRITAFVSERHSAAVPAAIVRAQATIAEGGGEVEEEKKEAEEEQLRPAQRRRLV